MMYNPNIKKFNINNSPNSNEHIGFLEITTHDSLTGMPVEDVVIASGAVFCLFRSFWIS